MICIRLPDVREAANELAGSVNVTWPASQVRSAARLELGEARLDLDLVLVIIERGKLLLER